ncbi:hypothetical protein SNEBB_010555 [Seison nebaliae]|nr:hypothetical protein SNEBB_010555 [Seison nebaliae]
MDNTTINHVNSTNTTKRGQDSLSRKHPARKRVKPRQTRHEITKPLNAILFNARSLRNKLDEFKALLTTEKPDIVAITETWIHSNPDGRDFIGEYDMPGYKLFHKDRTDREGGGVLLYVQERLQPVAIDPLTIHEVIGVDLTFTETTYRVIVVYRSPHQTSELDTSLYKCLGDLMSDVVTLLLGDFNSHLDWENQTAVGDSTRLLNFANDHYLHQWVTQPTRQQHILDVVFTTDDEIISSINVGETLGNSDHNLIRFCVEVPNVRKGVSPERQLNLRRADFNQLRERIEQLRLDSEDNADTMWNILKNKFMKIQEDCIPTKLKKSSKSNPKWFNRDIAAAIKKRKTAYQQRNNQQQNEEIFHEQCRNVKRLLRTAKRTEEERIAAMCKTSPKEFFSYVKSRKPIKHTIGPLKDSNGTVTTSPQEAANVLNEYFTSVFTSASNDDIPMPQIIHRGETLDNIVTDIEEVKKKIGELNQYKSPGPDGFHPRILKEVKEQLAPQLIKVYRKSLQTGEVPSDWRHANVAPIFKKGSRQSPGNYRPISLTSIPGKILESIIILNMASVGTDRASQISWTFFTG